MHPSGQACRRAVSLAVALLALSLLLSCKNEPAGDQQAYVYPGSGVPHLAGDREIADLNAELSRFFGITAPESRREEGGWLIENSETTHFVSEKVFAGSRFSCRVEVAVVQGFCAIAFNDLVIEAEPQEVRVKHSGADLRAWTNSRLEALVFERFSTRDAFSVRIYADGRLLDIVAVPVTLPARLRIDMEKATTARIGEWTWLRGFE